MYTFIHNGYSLKFPDPIWPTMDRSDSPVNNGPDLAQNYYQGTLDTLDNVLKLFSHSKNTFNFLSIVTLKLSNSHHNLAMV